MHRIRTALTALAGLLCLYPVGSALYYAGHLADSYYIRQGEQLELAAGMTAAPVRKTTPAALMSSDKPEQIQLRMFGIVPVKQVALQTTEEVMLVPCGQPFGVRMLMDGIMVIGFGEVAASSGGCCPASDAGIQTGDIIQAINQQEISCTNDFKTAVAESDGQAIDLTICRDGMEIELELKPEYSILEHCWQSGVWVRDSTAGIGTMTYYDPSDGSFGGLGHPICDPDTGGLIPLGSGTADAVTISGAIPGQPGSPGQLQGYFSAGDPIGTLVSNTPCGIFGHLEDVPGTMPAVPMGLKQEITLGDALILTTVSGSEPKAYTVRITALDYSDSTQNMMIEITDPALLADTGGIVQGMSGSPILQNGKLIGAVTHVFVSQPSMGYGIFAETMYESDP